jgi:ribose transport system permease protein
VSILGSLRATVDEPAAAPPAGLEGDGHRARRLLTGSSTWMTLFLLGMLVVFTILKPDAFASTDNARNLFLDASIIVVMGVGMTFVIVTAGIDLSVGSVLVFASVVSAKAMSSVGGDGWGTVLVGLVVAILAGMAWGVLNGLLVAKARVPALIVTLGTLGMALGAALLITDGFDLTDLPSKLTNDFGIGRLGGQVPYIVIVAAVVALLGGLLLAFTRFGMRTYAIGSNPEAARRAGIDVNRHLVMVYGLAGALAGLAGFLSLSRFSTTSVAGHAFDNLQVITAVVLGGTSLFGGIGTVAGTVVGAFIPVILSNGLVITGVQPFWQQIATGAILILAVYLDQLRRQAQSRA